MTEQQYYGGKLPKTPVMQYVQEVINEYLKQQSKVDKLECKVNKKDI